MLISIAVTALLGCTGIAVWLAVSSPRDLWAPRVLSRTYKNAPLGNAISELERDRVISSGSQWERAELKHRTFSAALRPLSTDFDALAQIGVAAGVNIQVPVGQHGEIRGVVIIRDSDRAHRAGAWGYHHRLPPNQRLHPTRTAALLHRGAILQRVAVRAGEPQVR